MIGKLRGIILEKHFPSVLLEAGGVGYEVHMPTTSFPELPDTGKEVTVFTHFLVREDTHLLFGFNNKQERTLFRDLIKTNGIGSKIALSILSNISAQQFFHAIEEENFNLLMKIPGIGKKTAGHLIIEMKDRCKGLYNNLFTPLFTSPNNTLSVENKNAEQEAVSALISLGYKPQEASRMIRKVARPDANNETLIREALRLALYRVNKG